MNIHADKTTQNKSQSVANGPVLQNNSKSPFTLVDNRPEAIVQRKLQHAGNTSARIKQLSAFQQIANNSAQAVQLRPLPDTIQMVRKSDLGLFEFELYTKIKEALEQGAPGANKDLIHSHAQSIRNNVISYLKNNPDLNEEPYETSLEKALTHFREKFEPIYLGALNGQQDQVGEHEEDVPVLIPQDPQLKKLLDHLSASWRLEQNSPGFRERVQALEIFIISPYPNGNCHGYSIRMEDVFMDFSIEEWRQTQPAVIVYTSGTAIHHSARISGGGRLTQTFSNGMPLFSCNQAAFTEYAGYDGNYTLPAQVEALKATTGYVERTPEEMAFLELLDDTLADIAVWRFDDNKEKEDLYAEVDAMGFDMENESARLAEIIARIEAIKAEEDD